MQSNWAGEHSEALREYLAKGMSYTEIADAINVRFKTAYSRNATLGRAKRMGVAGPGRPENLLKHWPMVPPKAEQPRPHKLRERLPPEFMRPMPIFEHTETAKLRCVEIDPRHLSLIELEPGDCRYPYGGDEEGEAITFCGHPRRQGSSYCVPHFHLTRGLGTASERTAGTVLLRLVAAYDTRTGTGDDNGQNEAAAASPPYRAFARAGAAATGSFGSPRRTGRGVAR